MESQAAVSLIRLNKFTFIEFTIRMTFWIELVTFGWKEVEYELWMTSLRFSHPPSRLTRRVCSVKFWQNLLRKVQIVFTGIHIIGIQVPQAFSRGVCKLFRIDRGFTCLWEGLNADINLYIKSTLNAIVSIFSSSFSTKHYISNWK